MSRRRRWRSLEAAASEKLGIGRLDRPAIFREAADAATDSDLPYWLVLTLSGIIATLGVALDSSAVVIGAMLIAPLLAPVIGLALALAVGDVRLTAQTGLAVVVSTVAIVGASALLSAVLPFHTVTPEISARTRPTTLDLAIAVFAGMAGSIVTVGRERRISAAIPGVVVAVALIPPLAVAGFVIGAGLEPELIWGSMLLFGANLGGIVLSGMIVFFLTGMHRAGVQDAARVWQGEDRARGLVAWFDRWRWIRVLGVSRTPLPRLGLVCGFVIAVGVPLTASLTEITREARVQRAVSTAAERFDVPGRSSVLDQQVIFGRDRTQAYIRIATTSWFGEDQESAFEREASRDAREPVRLILEQLPATGEDIRQLPQMALARGPHPVVPPPPPRSTRLNDLLVDLRRRVRQASHALSWPDCVAVAGADLSLGTVSRRSLRVGYATSERLPAETERELARQLQVALGDRELPVVMEFVSTVTRRIGDVRPDPGRLDEIAALLRRYEQIRVELVAGRAVPETALEAAQDRLAAAGVDRDRIATRRRPDASGISADIVPIDDDRTRPDSRLPQP